MDKTTTKILPHFSIPKKNVVQTFKEIHNAYLIINSNRESLLRHNLGYSDMNFLP